jgi:hypothetical protein
MDKNEYQKIAAAIIDLGDKLNTMFSSEREVDKNDIINVAEAYNNLDAISSEIGQKIVEENEAEKKFYWLYSSDIRDNIASAINRVCENIGTGGDDENVADVLDSLNNLYSSAVTQDMRNVSITDFPDSQINDLLK